MRYLVIDGILGGTGIRNQHEGGYIDPEQLLLSDQLLARLKEWKNARDMGLIPDEYSDYDMINFIQDSTVPKFEGNNASAEFRELGKWLYDNRDALINNIPSFFDR